MNSFPTQQGNHLKWLRSILLVGLALLWSVPVQAEGKWESMGEGLMGMQKVIPKSAEWRRMSIHALRIDLKTHQLKILRPAQGKVASVSAMVDKSEALAGINGSFFFEDLSPMGLLISEGVSSNPLRKVDWGVFYVEKAGRANLIHTRDWSEKKRVDFAIQTGPRLVVDGKPLTFRDSMARRSAVCVIDGDTVVLLATDNAVMMRDLAVFLSRPESMGGMGCRSALNLDGGSSTHFVVPGEKGFGVHGFDRVPVGIGVFKSTVSPSSQGK